EQTKRRCRCIELDPKYCDVIVKRYIEFIGNNKNVHVIRNGQRLEFSEVAQ
ncbi:MAG: DNA methylase N-4/N-6 protein, partial [Escherichia coli DORA_A_5_14_21]